MAEYIEREKVLELIDGWKRDDAVPHCVGYSEGWNEALEQIKYNIEELHIPAADVRPERHGHIIWKERHSGGIRHRECLSDHGIFLPPCNKIATIDDRCIEKRPYCSECGKLLDAVYLNYCGNCGAKMDGKDGDTGEE